MIGNFWLTANLPTTDCSAETRASVAASFRVTITRCFVGLSDFAGAVAVELKYTELLVPTGGVYEFMYPTVVGPRWALLGPALLTLAPLQSWFSRDAYAELPLEVLVLGGLWLFSYLTVIHSVERVARQRAVQRSAPATPSPERNADTIRR